MTGKIKSRTKKTRKRVLYKGLPIIDAPANTGMSLSVTSDDVKGSRKNDPAHCAAARAGKRELHTDVHVFLTRAYVKEKKHWVRYMTPESVSREIISFDRGSAFVPGDYEFRAPTMSARLGEHKSGTSKGPGTKKKGPYHVTADVREWHQAK